METGETTAARVITTGSELTLTVPLKSPNPGSWFHMPERDWNRFGEYLKELGTAIPPIHDRYVMFAGIAGGGLVGFLGWLATYFTIKDPSLAFYVIGMALIAVTLASGGIAWSNRETETYLTSKLRRDSDLLWNDMNRTYPFETGDKSQLPK